MGLLALNLSASRGGQPVLRDVALSAQAGQWMAVVGPNGAGKSTLLVHQMDPALAWLQQACQGRIHLMDQQRRFACAIGPNHSHPLPGLS